MHAKKLQQQKSYPRSMPFYEISDIRNSKIIHDLRELSRTWKNPWDSIPVENTCLHTTPSLADVALDEHHDPDLYFADFAIINNKVVWKKPAYAEYAKPTKLTMPPSFIALTTAPPPPSPHAEELPQDSSFKKRYRQAWREISHWESQINSEEWNLQCGAAEKAAVRKSVQHWTESVDSVVLNPYFRDNWPVPAFFQWYHSDLKSMSAYFTGRIKHNLDEYGNGSVQCGCHLNHRANTSRFEQRVYTEIMAWSKCVTNLFLPRGAPFVKCLWMHTAILEPECYFTSDECTRGGEVYYHNLEANSYRAKK